MVLAPTLSQHIKMWIRDVNVVNMQQCYFGFNEHYIIVFPQAECWQPTISGVTKIGFF